MKLTSLFRDTEPSAIAELRQCAGQNTKDQNWQASFSLQAQELDAEAKRLRESLAKAPSDELARQYVQAQIAADTRKKALVDAGHVVVHAINRVCVARTKPILQRALEAVRKRLIDERAAVVKSDEESAERLGVSGVDTASPIVGRSDMELNRAATYLNDLDAATEMTKLRSAVEFCLA